MNLVGRIYLFQIVRAKIELDKSSKADFKLGETTIKYCEFLDQGQLSEFEHIKLGSFGELRI
jgi:hypothetical protein